ncbi:MAG: mandelate racemase/muconate lactonizing enzyme family protein [Thermomicrobiales bacterium]
MAAAREGAGPDVEIYIECAEFLSPRTAVLAAEALGPYRPAWFEEPIPFENIQAMADLRERIGVPIATGERLLSRFEFRDLLESGGADIIQPDLMHAGGITEVRKIAAMADTYYVPVAPHNPTGPICNLAALHLSAAIPNFHVLEQMEDERSLRDEISTHPIVYRDGYYELPPSRDSGTDLKLGSARGLEGKPHRMSGSSESSWW